MILFYSANCSHSKMLLENVNRYDKNKIIKVVPIDELKKQNINIESKIHSVPAFMILPSKELLFGKDVFDYLLLPGRGILCGVQNTRLDKNITDSAENKIRPMEQNTDNEPSAFALNSNKLSDNFSTIDEDNKIHEYPDDMTRLAQTYTLIGNYKSEGDGQDLEFVISKSTETCKTLCNSNSECAGFEYYNGSCNLKNSGMFPIGARVPDPNSELYLRDKTVKNDISCSKDIDSGYSTQWELYPTSNKMSMNTLCALGAITQDERNSSQASLKELNKATNIMSNKLKSISNEKTDITDSFGSAKKKLSKNIKEYGSMRHKILTNDKNIKNIIGMYEDTELLMTSHNIKFFLFANLAIIIAIASIKLMRS